MSDSLALRIETVQQRIQDALQRSGRGANEVRLIGASKRRSCSEIRTAYTLGITQFGENYVPELLEKASMVPEADFHFIGHLQRNKARRLLSAGIGWIHTVDNLRLANTLQRYVQHPLRSLIQVNLAGETTKAGVEVDEATDLARAILADCPDIGLCGLMTLPPRDENPSHWFNRLSELRDSLEKELGHPLPELSMGMSGDLEAAIQCGATLIRVGTALFGQRPA